MERPSTSGRTVAALHNASPLLAAPAVRRPRPGLCFRQSAPLGRAAALQAQQLGGLPWRQQQRQRRAQLSVAAAAATDEERAVYAGGKVAKVRERVALAAVTGRALGMHTTAAGKTRRPPRPRQPGQAAAAALTPRAKA